MKTLKICRLFPNYFTSPQLERESVASNMKEVWDRLSDGAPYPGHGPLLASDGEETAEGTEHGEEEGGETEGDTAADLDHGVSGFKVFSLTVYLVCSNPDHPLHQHILCIIRNIVSSSFSFLFLTENCDL